MKSTTESVPIFTPPPPVKWHHVPGATLFNKAVYDQPSAKSALTSIKCAIENYVEPNPVWGTTNIDLTRLFRLYTILHSKGLLSEGPDVTVLDQ